MTTQETLKNLAQGFMVAIAMAADENNLQTTDEVDRFENELETAIFDGLDAARTRANLNDDHGGQEEL